MKAALALLAAVAALASPLLVHGLDQGLAEVSVTELAAGLRPQTGNFVLAGTLETGSFERAATTKNGVEVRSALRFAVVPEGFREGDPVAAVLELEDRNRAELVELAGLHRWRCTARNVLWEGLTGRDRDFFRQTLGLAVTSQTLLCELTPARAAPDLVLFAGILLAALATLSLLSFAARRFAPG